MKTMRVRAALAVLFAVPSVLWAGFCSSSPGSEPRHDYQFLAGYSSASKALIHRAVDRRFVFAAFSYSYRCWVGSSISLNLATRLLSAAILIQPTETLLNAPPLERTVPGRAIYGFAMAPLRLTAELARGHRVHPFVETTEGMIASTEPIRENRPNTTGLNPLIEGRGSIRWNILRRDLSFSYGFLYISNAGTTSFNPGVNNNLIYLGYSFSP